MSGRVGTGAGQDSSLAQAVGELGVSAELGAQRGRAVRRRTGPSGRSRAAAGPCRPQRPSASRGDPGPWTRRPSPGPWRSRPAAPRRVPESSGGAAPGGSSACLSRTRSTGTASVRPGPNGTPRSTARRSPGSAPGCPYTTAFSFGSSSSRIHIRTEDRTGSASGRRARSGVRPRPTRRRSDPPPYPCGVVGVGQAQQEADRSLGRAVVMHGRMMTQTSGGSHRISGGPALRRQAPARAAIRALRAASFSSNFDASESRPPMNRPSSSCALQALGAQAVDLHDLQEAQDGLQTSSWWMRML